MENILRSRAIVATIVAFLSLVPRGATAQASANMRAVPAGDPAAWFAPIDYPPAAIRSNRQGRVVVTVAVDATGRVTGCQVKVPSGTDLLDARTCELAISRGRFQPGTDAAGRPVASQYDMPVRWAMPGATDRVIDVTTAAPVDQIVETEVTIGPDGRLAGCRARIVQTNGSDPDPCKAAIVGTDMHQHWVRNGKPIGATVITRMSQHVTIDP